jgi:hypothetical protein
MQETEVRQALQAYVDDGEPVMGLTAAGILTAGRRSRRNRRLAGYAGAGLVTALAGAGVVAVLGGGSPGTDRYTGPDFAAAAPCPVTPGPRPPGAVTADRPLPPDVLRWATTSLTCHLSDEVPRLLPTARFAQVPGAAAGPLLGFSHGGQPPFGNRVDSMTLIRDARGTGDLNVFVGVVDPATAARAETDCRSQTGAAEARCSVRTGPHRETVLLSTEAGNIPAEEPRNVVVRVYRGHTEINVQVSNTDRRSVDGRGPVATRPQPVLTAEQTVQLALSPELYLFP